jgi:hypothetical protein
VAEAAKRRGRAPTGEAKSASERSKERDSALIAAGGKIISRLRLGPEAAAALARLRASGAPTDRAAIEQALLGRGI